MQFQRRSLDQNIAEFIYNSNSCKHVVNADQITWQSIQQQRRNFNALFVASLMNCVTNDPHFLIKQTSLNNKLVFIATENIHDHPDDQSITQAYLVRDYIQPFITNLAKLDLTKTSCSYDPFSSTFILTTDIPSF